MAKVLEVMGYVLTSEHLKMDMNMEMEFKYGDLAITNQKVRVPGLAAGKKV